MTQPENKYSYTTKKPGKTKAFFICLIVASLLWLAHSLNTVYFYTLQIPIAIKNLPANKHPLTELPKHLSVEIKASGLKLFFILLNRPFKPVTIDFNNLATTNKNQSYVLSSSGLKFKDAFNFETQIRQIRPDTLYFSERTGLQKTVAVKVPLQIKCKEGYGFKRTLIEPAYTAIWGDTSLLNNIDTIYTQPLIINGLDKNVVTNVTIIKPGKDVYTFINDVGVTIETARLIEQSIVLQLSDVAHLSGKQTSIFPSRVKVRFTCIQNDFNPSDSIRFKAVINSAKTNPLTKKCPIFLTSFPENVTVMGFEPKEAEFLILKN